MRTARDLKPSLSATNDQRQGKKAARSRRIARGGTRRRAAGGAPKVPAGADPYEPRHAAGPSTTARRFDRPRPGQRLHMGSLSGAVEAPWRTPARYDLFLRATVAITRHAEDLRAAFRGHGLQRAGQQPGRPYPANRTRRRQPHR